MILKGVTSGAKAWVTAGYMVFLYMRTWGGISRRPRACNPVTCNPPVRALKGEIA